VCVIIQSKFKNINDKILIKSFNRNPHGFGLMYLNTQNNLITKKFFTKKLSKIKKEFLKIKNDLNNGQEIALHFRYNTAGQTNNFNSHPFKILEKNNGDLYDLALMHNSPTITTLEIEKNKSDTYHFCEYYLKPILKNNPTLIKNESFLNDLESLINTHIDTRVLLLENFTNSFHYLGKWKKNKKLNLLVSNNLFDEYKPRNFTRWVDDSYGLDVRPRMMSYDEMIDYNNDKIFNDDLKPYAKNNK